MERLLLLFVFQMNKYAFLYSPVHIDCGHLRRGCPYNFCFETAPKFYLLGLKLSFKLTERLNTR